MSIFRPLSVSVVREPRHLRGGHTLLKPMVTLQNCSHEAREHITKNKVDFVTCAAALTSALTMLSPCEQPIVRFNATLIATTIHIWTTHYKPLTVLRGRKNSIKWFKNAFWFGITFAVTSAWTQYQDRRARTEACLPKTQAVTKTNLRARFSNSEFPWGTDSLSRSFAPRQNYYLTDTGLLHSSKTSALYVAVNRFPINRIVVSAAVELWAVPSSLF